MVISTKKTRIFVSLIAPESLASQDRCSHSVPRRPDYSPYSVNFVLTQGIPPDFSGSVHFCIIKPPYAMGSVLSLSGHATAYRCHLLLRVRRRGPVALKVVLVKRVLPFEVHHGLFLVHFYFPTPIWSFRLHTLSLHFFNAVGHRPIAACCVGENHLHKQ